MLKPYEIWLLLFVIVPLIFLWAVKWRLYWQYRLTIIWVVGLSTALSFVWDYTAIAWQIWFWPPGCCNLPKVHNLPLEEILFFVFVSLFIISITLALRERATATTRKRKR